MSDSDNDTRMFGAEIDADIAEIIDDRLKYGEKSSLIREFANSIAHGGGYDERTALDIQIERRKEQLTNARETRRNADARIETLEEKISNLQEQRESKQSREEKFEASLVPIEADLREGTRMFPEAGAIRAVAREYQMGEGEVLEKLKQRNPDVPERAFTPKSPQTDEWNGLPLKQQGLPVEKRGGPK